MATLVDRIQVWIDSRANVQGFAQASAASTQLQTQQQGLLGRLAANKTAVLGWGAAAATAGILAVGAAKKAADEFEDVAASVRNVQRATGESAETASRWVAIADDFGITGDQVGMAFGRLGKNIQTGTVDLRTWGAEVVRGKDGGVDMQATLLSIADAYAAESDASARSEMLLKAFGRSGRDLIPILEGGSDAIREMFAAVPDAQIFDQGQVDAAREYGLAMDDLEDSLREVALTLGSEVAPLLSEVGRGFAEGARGVKSFVEALPDDSVSGVFETLWDIGPISQFTEALGAAGKVFEGDILGGLQQFAERGNPFGAAATGARELFGTGFDADKMVRDLVKSQEKGKESSDRHGASLRAQAGSVRALKAAVDEYVAQTLGVEQANLRVESAMQTYNQALIENGEGSLEAREAQTQVMSAIIAAGDAAKTATGSTQGQVATLNFLAGTLAPGSPLRTWLEGYIATLGSIPAAKGTVVTADVSAAQAATKAFLDSIPEVVRVKIEAWGEIKGGALTGE